MGIYTRLHPSGHKAYYARVRYHGRQYLSAACPSRELARIEEARLLDAKHRGRLEEEFGSNARQPSPKLRDVVEDYLVVSAQENAASTVTRKRGTLKHLCCALGSRALDTITSFDVERYKKRRRRIVSGPTVNRELATLSHLMNWARRLGYAEVNPVQDVRRFRENLEAWSYLSDQDVRALLRSCRGADAKAPHLYPMVVLALDTGLRKGELLGLRWNNIDLVGGEIYVERSKTRNRSVLPLTKRSTTALQALPRHGPRPFCRPDGTPLEDVRRSFATALQRAGLPPIRWHDLRHTFASTLVRRGANVFVVQQLLGHTTLAMTRRYAHLSPDELRAAVGLLDNAATESAPDQAQQAAPRLVT